MNPSRRPIASSFCSGPRGPGVDNGGHVSLFFNTQMDYYEETVAALVEAGLPRHAELLERVATTIFGRASVPHTLTERNEIIDQPRAESSEIDADLNACDREFAALGSADAVLNALELWYRARA